MFIVPGMKSSPTPSTLYGAIGPEYIEPSGSAPTTWTLGFFSLRYFATPLIVPPVPMPATKTSTRPSVCSQISGPVVW